MGIKQKTVLQQQVVISKSPLSLEMYDLNFN